MNLKKLREAESIFLHRYPGGFADEEMQHVAKKHNVNKLSEFAATALAKKAFVNQGAVLDDIVKIVSRSSMVSMFEKPKFRDYVNGLNRDDREFLAGMMETVEDIPKQAILSGLPWDWDSYGGYLDSVERLAPMINVAGLVGHCATRFYVMGERSVEEPR